MKWFGLFPKPQFLLAATKKNYNVPLALTNKTTFLFNDPFQKIEKCSVIFFIKIRLYLAARRVENISSGVIFNLLSGGFLILAKIKIHYFEQKNCMLEINNHLRFKMIETPDNTAWSFEGHELKKWTNQKGEKWKIFVTFTVFF